LTSTSHQDNLVLRGADAGLGAENILLANSRWRMLKAPGSPPFLRRADKYKVHGDEYNTRRLKTLSILKGVFQSDAAFRYRSDPKKVATSGELQDRVLRSR
jgi:hypothetical protein